MPTLYGISAPEGEGLVIEVHLDITQLNREFETWLEAKGFADDPFLVFYPPQYHHHRTGRNRIPQALMSSFLPKVAALVEEVVLEATRNGIGLYAETELVREIIHFSPERTQMSLSSLDSIVAVPSVNAGTAKADIHVEFLSGAVSDEVREYLGRKGFYWVSTPATAAFPSEEIATLQTATFEMAKSVFGLLSRIRLPGCTGIHLEQKLAMVASASGLPMPQVMDVKYL